MCTKSFGISKFHCLKFKTSTKYAVVRDDLFNNAFCIGILNITHGMLWGYKKLSSSNVNGNLFSYFNIVIEKNSRF